MHRQRLAVGFADLAHYARLVETQGDEEAVRHLQDALNFAGDVIAKHGGRIRKYLGDTILFTFDDAKQAERAAREIATGYRKDVGDLSVRWHVAVATGEVLVGQIGHPSHVVEDVMGKTVNRAALLVGEAQRSEEGYAVAEEP